LPGPLYVPYTSVSVKHTKSKVSKL
jgi:hypothetical protein